MGSFSNFNASDLGSTDLDFEQYQNLDFDFLPVETQSQSDGNRKNLGTHDYHQHNAALLTSGNLSSHHNFTLAAVTPPFTLPNDMLPTPEGSEHNVCPDAMLMSPYTLTTIEEAFQEDERRYFESLEISALGNQQCISYYVNPGLSSPLTSPASSPIQIVNVSNNSPIIPSSQKSCSSLNHVNNVQRFSTINKQKSEKSNSISQNPRRKSSHNNNVDDINHSSENNGNGTKKLTMIMTDSPPQMVNMTNLEQMTSPMMNMVIAPSTSSSTAVMQEPMPNLNLGSNLVSAATSTLLSLAVQNGSSAPSFSENIAPITPSSLMKLNEKSSLKPSQSGRKSGQEKSSPKSSQNQTQNLKQSGENKDQTSEQRSSGKEINQSIFIAPSPPTKKSIKVATTVASGTQPMTIQPNVSPVSPRTMSPMILPSSPIARRSYTHNGSSSTLNSSKSPQALKPTISPNLKPKLPGVIADEVAEQLAKKSNYQSILEGTAKSLGISYSSDVHSSLESRRTTHKAAEQKRRDSLKQSFDELKKVVPFHSTDSTHDYIVELHKITREKDDIIQKLSEELGELRQSKKQKVEHDQQNEDKMEISKDKSDA